MKILARRALESGGESWYRDRCWIRFEGDNRKRKGHRAGELVLRRERRRCMSLDRNMGRLMQTNRCSGETEAVIARTMQKLFRRFHE